MCSCEYHTQVCHDLRSKVAQGLEVLSIEYNLSTWYLRADW